MKVGLLIELFLHDASSSNSAMPSGDHYIPADNCHYLFKHQTPPARSLVWIGTVDTTRDVPPFSSIGAAIKVQETTPNGLVIFREHGYLSLFTIGRLAMRVIGWDLEPQFMPLAIPDPTAQKPDKLIPLWPKGSRRVTWPPPRVLSKRDLGDLSHNNPEW
jgi:hypothetical protein